jgi:hypothetical protein
MSEVEDAAPPAANRAWGSWVGKAVFEAGLIVLGLVGALLIDEWRDDRERRARIDAAMASVRAELLENKRVVDARLSSNLQLVEELYTLAKERGPKAYYGKGIVRPGEPISDIAWEAARNSGITTDVPFDRLVVLGRAYGALVGLRTEMSTFSDSLYVVPGLVEELRNNPTDLAGRYNDINRRIETLQKRVDEALRVIPPSAR